MNRLVLLVGVAVLVGVIALGFILFGDSAPQFESDPESQAKVLETGEEVVPEPMIAEVEEAPPVPPPSGESGGLVSPLAPASYREALAGITGRVLEEDGAPVVGIEVGLLELALSALLSRGAALPTESLKPEELTLEVGNAITDKDGRFTIPGAVGTSFHAIAVDLGGPRGALRVLESSLHGGEITDVGDVILAPFVTFVGKVTDDEGRGVAGARVRCTDLPPLIFQAGVQHLRHDTRLIVSNEFTGSMVFELPPWLMQYERKLPIPTTYTEADGSFRLPGVPRGLVSVVADADDLVATTKGGIPTGRRPEKNVGTVVLSHGITLTGSVLDGDGNGLEGVEVLAGAVVPLGDVALSRPPVFTDAKGRFSVAAVPANSQVSFAARLRKGLPWKAVTEHDGTDVQIVFDALGSLVVDVRDERGKPVKDTRLYVRGETLPMGVPAMLDSGATLEEVAAQTFAGTLTIPGLPHGSYSVVAEAPGFAAAGDEVLVDGDSASLQLVLRRGVDLRVEVRDAANSEPVEYVQVLVISPQNFDPFSPVLARGRTDDQGSVHLGAVAAAEDDELVLSLQHPAYAMQAVPFEPDASGSATVTVELETGGTLAGLVHYGGRPPDQLYMLIVNPDIRGPESFVNFAPRFTLSDLEGKFKVSNLPEGDYEYSVYERFLNVDATKFVANLIKDEEPDDIESGEFHIAAGQTTEISIDMSPEAQGPVATIRGSVRVNGEPVEGLRIHTYGEKSRQQKRTATDDTGAFELLELPAGEINFSIQQVDPEHVQLVNESIELTPGDVKVLNYDLRTIPVTFRVLDRDGRPQGGVSANLSGSTKETRGNHQYGFSGDDGVAHMQVLKAGSYRVQFEHNLAGKARRDIEITDAGITEPQDVFLDPGVPFAGKVVLEGFGKLDWCWVQIKSLDEGVDSEATFVLQGADRDFSVSGLKPGRYSIQLHSARGQGSQPLEQTIPAGGLKGVELRLVKESK